VDPVAAGIGVDAFLLDVGRELTCDENGTPACAERMRCEYPDGSDPKTLLAIIE
jgi:hypothetical protein